MQACIASRSSLCCRCGENLFEARGSGNARITCAGPRENTIAAFSKAAGLGADFVEFDVQVPAHFFMFTTQCGSETSETFVGVHADAFADCSGALAVQ